MNATCPTCGRHLVPAGGGGAGDAEHGTVRGTLDGPARWGCPDGHGDIMADVDAALAEVHDTLDIAERSRLRNTLRCAACQTPFALPGRRATRSVTLVTTGLPATRLTFDLPLLRCTEDAVESLPPECVGDLDAVVSQLLGGPA